MESRKRTISTAETVMSERDISSEIRDGEPFVRMVLRYIPRWAWYFSGACMFVPISVASLNEITLPVMDVDVIVSTPVFVLPDGIAIVGAISAAICIFASFSSLAARDHFVLCILITAATWAVFVWGFYSYGESPFLDATHIDPNCQHSPRSGCL